MRIISKEALFIVNSKQCMQLWPTFVWLQRRCKWLRQFERRQAVASWWSGAGARCRIEQQSLPAWPNYGGII